MNQSQSVPPIEQVPRYEFVPRTDVREPITGREDCYRPWEAPGIIHRMQDEAIELHQSEVDRMFDQLIDAHMPDECPKPVRDLARQSIFASDTLLNIENVKGYENRLMLLPELELDDAQLEVHRKVLAGTATIAEIAADMDVTGRSSAQLALLRTVNGYRGKYEDGLNEELNEFMGVQSQLPVEPPKLRVTHFDASFYNGEPAQAMILQHKQEYGTRADGTEVKARVSLEVRIDPSSGFDEGIREAIEAASRSRMDHVVQLARVRPLLLEIARVGIHHPSVVAGMKTLYRYSPETQQRLEAQSARKKASMDFDSTKMHRVNFKD